MTSRRKGILVANLDCERDFPAALPHLGSEQDSGPVPTSGQLSKKARQKVDLLGSKLRVLGEDTDDLLLRPEEYDVAPSRGRSRAVLAWGETEGVQRLRSKVREPLRAALEGGLPRLPLHHLLWKLPVASPKAVARANHRSFHLTVARELGASLPGAAMIDSLEDLVSAVPATTAGDDRSDSGTTSRARSSSWVLKTPFGAAGRGRVFLEADWRGHADVVRRIQRLLRQHGSLLLERWMDRDADFGCCAIVVPGDLRIIGVHRQIVTARGVFRALELGTEPLSAPGLAREEISQLRGIVSGVAERLLALGYHGPFGIDAWRYLDGQGVAHFHPLGEINARLTFGFLEHALRERRGSRPPGE